MTFEEWKTGFSKTECVVYPAGYFEQQRETMLVVVPDLELNGAQTVLSELLELISDQFAFTILSPTDGMYRKLYGDKGYHVVVKTYISGSQEFRTFLQTAFDRIWINTSSCSNYLYYFINTSAPVYWWLHETREQLEATQPDFPNPNLYSDNIHILSVTKAVQRGIQEKYSYKTELLPMPIRDENDVEVEPNGKSRQAGSELRRQCDIPENAVLFFIPGAYTIIKGQDLMLDAISRLPEEYAEKSCFVFCGYQLPGQEQYYRSLQNISEHLNNVKILESIPREQVYQWYQASDCVCAPSRIDATPTTIVEAMMFQKLVLVSSQTGISEYLTDCVDGFVYQNEEELRKRLLLIISDPEA